MGSRRFYGDEFKEQAVRLVHDSGDSIPSIAADLGINAGNLRWWVRESRDDGGGSSSLSKDEAAIAAAATFKALGGGWQAAMENL
jgi:transposase-like protein